jgi:ABC-2 type transport system ATP-binding protein
VAGGGGSVDGDVACRATAEEGTIMTTALDAQLLGKRYRRRWALRECDLSIPAGHVIGLVGPNGAGKSTLLSMAAGHVRPSVGAIRVLGMAPAAGRGAIGYVAQDAPLYAELRVADHLALGRRLNSRWDDAFARTRLGELGIAVADRAGRLSGGQRAQLALTLALAKRPELLLLDEPVASLDPLARREFLDDLGAAQASTVVLSSHVVSDLAAICDYLIVLDTARVVAAGRITDLLAGHGAADLDSLVLAFLGAARRDGQVRS